MASSRWSLLPYSVFARLRSRSSTVAHGTQLRCSRSLGSALM